MEKSLQRIQNGQRNAMYTSQQSVENKVGGIPGWQALLTAVGFRLDPAASGLPAAVFFPTSDPGDRLQQCSSTLQALLGKLLQHRGDLVCNHTRMLGLVARSIPRGERESQRGTAMNAWLVPTLPTLLVCDGCWPHLGFVLS